MDIQTRKINFVQEFLNLQNEELISVMENMLQKLKSNNINPMSIDELNRRIDKSMEDSKHGRLTEVNDLLAEIQQWA